jgi:hypothetical protein
MGYTKVRHYVVGMADWLEHGAAVEKSAALIEAPPVRSSARQNIRRRLSWLEILANWPLERLVGFWVGMISIFWRGLLACRYRPGWGLQAGNAEVGPTERIATAIYSVCHGAAIGYGRYSARR